MFAFSCPKCQKTLKAPEEKIGARTKCPYCQCPVQVPSGPDAPVVAYVIPADDAGRSGVSLAWSIVVGLVLLPIAIIAVLVFSWGSKSSETGEPSTSSLSQFHKPGDAKVQPMPGDAKVGVETRFGNLGITVSVCVNMYLVMPSGNRATNGSNFLVGIKYTNYDDSTVIRVKPQSTGNFRLTDDKGNVYRRYIPTDEFGREWPLLASFSFTSAFYDLKKNEVGSVRSDRNVTDLLVFEEPLPGAKLLTLVLDASLWGGTGELRLEGIHRGLRNGSKIWLNGTTLEEEDRLEARELERNKERDKEREKEREANNARELERNKEREANNASQMAKMRADNKARKLAALERELSKLNERLKTLLTNQQPGLRGKIEREKLEKQIEEVKKVMERVRRSP
jgi:hypothetical protein